MTPEEVLKFARDNAVEFVDLRFMDLPATGHRSGCRHVTIPLSELTLRTFQDGLEPDGLSICGQPQIEQPDLLLVPDAQTAHLDPFSQHPTLAMLCDLKDHRTRKDHAADPRAVVRRAAARLSSSGIADQAHFAPGLEFYVLDQVCYEQGVNAARYQVDSREGVWGRGRDEPDNLGTQLPAGTGTGALPPFDSLHNLRSEMVAALTACGIQAGAHQHAAATAGHTAIGLRPGPLVEIADRITICKYVVRNVAARYGKVVTFMPQPLFGESGSGLHTRLSLWQGGQPLLCGEGGAELSEAGRWAVGGLMKHAGSLLALTCPTTNSYRRLASGHGGPTHLTFASRLRPVLVRIPTSRPGQSSNWVEFRALDASCNPYLAFSALLLAVLDGVEHRMDPGPPLEKRLDNSSTPDAERLPTTLEQALRALEADHGYLLKGGVFTEDLIGDWVKHKLEREVEPLRARPHPYEFCMYFDA